MIDWMFVCILFLALILFLIAIFYEDEINQIWLLGLVILDVALWWALAGAQFEIEIPYQLYNATSGNVETGIDIAVSRTSPAILYIFQAFGTIMFVYMNYVIYILLRDFYKKYLKGT